MDESSKKEMEKLLKMYQDQKQMYERQIEILIKQFENHKKEMDQVANSQQ